MNKAAVFELINGAALWVMSLLLASCGWLPRERSQPSAAPAELHERADAYREALPSVLDDYGFADVAHCDSTTFSGLLAAAGVDVQMEAAEVSPGEWLRRPAEYVECFATGASRSTISRDALLSVVWWAWSARELAVLERLWEFGSKRAWKMGDGRWGGVDTLANTNLIALLARAIDALGGDAPGWALALLPMWSDQVGGFERHLQVSQIALWGELTGSIPESAVALLQKHAEAQPWNPVLRAAADVWDGGDRTKASLDPRLWPAERLPTSADRCSAWVAMEDAWAPGWLGCPDEQPLRYHTGGELLFAVRLLRGPER
jgi:hypothetical protein